MEISKKLLLPIVMIAATPAFAKPKKNSLAPYRPALRELLLEEVQVERFRLEDPEEKKWLEIRTPSLVEKKTVQGSEVHRPVAIGSLHK